jgi:DnaJ-class molecular chaperone
MPICARCNGKGLINCPKCNGRGLEDEDQLELIAGTAKNSRKCPKCRGTGMVACPDCEGSGTVDDEDD